MNRTTIEWVNRPGTTPFTWNPIRARRKIPIFHAGIIKGFGAATTGTFCTRISPGCKLCYAAKINMRFGTGADYTVPNLADHEFYIDEKIMAEPLKRKKPATIFVGDMFDLFHEAIPTRMIDRVLEVIAACPQHVFQVLTKRAHLLEEKLYGVTLEHGCRELGGGDYLSNLWLGVSVEDQQRADERIPLLLQTPAAVRFLSVEPQLEAIDLTGGESIDGMPVVNPLTGADWCDPPIPGIDWCIVGGESGPGARPFNLAWAQSLLEQCKAAGVPYFLKQVGSNPASERDGPLRGLLEDARSKGGNMASWPKHLRLREFPKPMERVGAEYDPTTEGGKMRVSQGRAVKGTGCPVEST
jgi:protein gp37